MLGRLASCCRKQGWNFSLRPDEIGKHLSKTIFFGFSVGCFFKAAWNIAEGSADKSEIERRKERLAMVRNLLLSQSTSSKEMS
jgi:hypothetical protein